MQIGQGTLILNKAETYTGTTIIDSGTLQVGTGGDAATIASSSNVVDNGVLAFGRSDGAAGYPNPISGSGSVAQIGGGTLTLGGSNSYGGGTNIVSGVLAWVPTTHCRRLRPSRSGAAGSSGTLDLAGFSPQVAGLSVAAGAVASAEVIGNSGTNDATLTVSGVATFGGTIQGSLGGGTNQVNLTVAGGTLTLSGSNTYGGVTAINQGVLALGTNNALPTGTALVLGAAGSGGTLDLVVSASRSAP